VQKRFDVKAEEVVSGRTSQPRRGRQQYLHNRRMRRSARAPIDYRRRVRREETEQGLGILDGTIPAKADRAVCRDRNRH
jgi:hypothetical protein